MNATMETAKDAARRLAKNCIAKGFKPQALHEYTDESGFPVYWRIRLKHPDTGEKWIRPMKHDGVAFVLGEPPFPEGGKPLYLLHRLVANPGAPAWIGEGEQCAETLDKLGVLATTSGAADSTEKADWSIMAGRTVTIWPDNDEAGRRYAETVARILQGLGCIVRVVDVDALNLPHKGDVVDWLATHSNAAQGDLEGLPVVAYRPTQETQPADEYGVTVRLIRGSDVTPEPVSWLWNGWLAAGKMHVLGGAPGTGKTTIAMSLAATVTAGGRWPDASRSLAGNAIIWSGEDDPADTLIPRLALSGADLSRVYFIADVREGNERRSFDPAKDMEMLRYRLAEIGDVRLLIVDPIVSAIAGDSHKNAEVRRGLQPLADLAASMRCALLGITHFSKGTGGRDPVERLTGSLAFGALARVVLVAAKHQEEGEDGRIVRLFLRAKSNIGPDDGGFEYDLQQGELKTHPGIFASAVAWGNSVDGAARDLLATADATSDTDERDAVENAKQFLRDLLAGGPVSAKQVDADIRGAGYAPRTINRAKKLVGAISYKEGKTWFWRIEGTAHFGQDCQPCQEILTRNVGNLGNVESKSLVEVEI